MGRIVRGWMVAGLLLGTMTYAIAEDVTLTTYYPSPRGVYQQLKSNEDTALAIQSGGVAIAQASADAAYKLDVNGATRVRSDLLVDGTIRIVGGSPQAGWVLTATDSSGNAEWRAPTYQ